MQRTGIEGGGALLRKSPSLMIYIIYLTYYRGEYLSNHLRQKDMFHYFELPEKVMGLIPVIKFVIY